MPLVVPVKFKYSSRDLWFDPGDLDILKADYAICSTERGTEIGLVTADPFDVPVDEIGRPLKPVLRVATDTDLELADDLAIQGEEAMGDFRDLVEKNKLEMKPVGVEYLFGGEKAVFYFAAEDRVDFRQLVKDLSATFHIRVDMRQIGVRDETRLVGGYAQCGQELCCARFGGQFEPVSIRMAKEQDLPLNSSKISGVCGRLMCCLRYEFEAYKDFKSRAPKKKTLIDTPLGKARIQEYNTPREQLVLRLENGKTFRVNLADMTCSEGGKKRAEEQGCRCRPDCVTRDVLERIDSAEMRLALLELDRENGVDVGDGLSSADRLDATSTSSRRKRTGSNEGSRGRGRSTSGAAAEQAPTRRRRKRSVSASSEDTQTMASHPSSQNNNTRGGGMNPTRRRRRHMSAEERDEAFKSAAQASGSEGGKGGKSIASEQGAKQAENEHSQRPRRRRHTQAPSHKPETQSVADQVADGEVKVTRRRPGDGGGAGRAHSRASEQSGREANSEGGQSQKRRRRRRSRKPRQDGGAPETGSQGKGQSE